VEVIEDPDDDFEEDLPCEEFDEDVEVYRLPPPPPPAPRPSPPPPRSVPLPPPIAPPAPSPAVPARVANTDFAEQLRLQTIKGDGRSAMPWNLPAGWQGKVIADLERFVTPIQFPADLSHAKAVEIVRARVAEVLKPYHQAEERAKREKQAKEQADRRRAALIAHGNNYAWRETTDWDWPASYEARDEVKKVLERDVEDDWTEREVENAVDEVLDEWDDDEDEEWDED
jgi:hypothetical protein